MSAIEVYTIKGQWFAQLEGQPAHVARGSTQVEAVGRLISAKARRLNLVVRKIEPPKREET